MKLRLDEIVLEGMCSYGVHGVNPEERALGQRFAVKVAMAAGLAPGRRRAPS